MNLSRLRRPAVAVVGMTLALFVAQALLMQATLQYQFTPWDAWKLSVPFALIFCAALSLAAHVGRPKPGTLLFVGGFLALTMLARVAMLDYETADYTSFLAPWVRAFREGGFSTLAQNVGDYNLLYQYVLLLVSKSSLYDLYLIKLFSVAADYALAVVMMRAARHVAGERAAMPVLLLVSALPTVLLDGACWGQCDAVYVSLIVLSLLLLETGRPTRSAMALAVAFAFKLQTIFFFPVVLLALIHGKYRPRHALAFFGAYLVTMLPALIAGRSFFDALSVYASQSMGQYYDRLTYNAPNLYVFFPMLEFATSQEFTWMRYLEGIHAKSTNTYLTEELMPMLQTAALYACIALTLLVVIYWLMHAKEITPDMTLELALFFAIFLPFVMPKIHERYFYLADMLSVLYAARRSDRRFMPLLVAGASMLSYMPYLMRARPVDVRWISLMMLAALVIVSHDLLARMRQNRAALEKGGEAA